MPSTYPSPNAPTTPNVSNISILVAGPNPQRVGLYVFNPSPAVTLWVAPNGTPAIANGKGSVAIQPLQGVMFGPPNMPPFTSNMNAIASVAGNNPIAIWEYFP